MAAVALAVGCSDGGVDEPVRSQTPAMRFDDPGAGVEDLLLTTDDLVSPDGHLAGLRVVEDGPTLYEAPEQRGPCGGPVDAPDLADAGMAFISGPVTQGAQVVVPMPGSEAQDFVDQIAADARPGCEDWTMTTNTGEEQAMTFLRSRRLDVGATEAFVADHEMRVGPAVLWSSSAAMAAEDHLILFSVFSPEPPEPELVDDLVAAAAGKLGT